MRTEMEKNRIVLGIVGSPNPEGRTNRLVMAALKGRLMLEQRLS